MCTLLCSATSQDSNAEFKRDVAIPLKIRPSSSTLNWLKCLVTQPLVYIMTYARAAFFLPLQQVPQGHSTGSRVSMHSQSIPSIHTELIYLKSLSRQVFGTGGISTFRYREWYALFIRQGASQGTEDHG